MLPSLTRPPPEVLSLFVAHHNGAGGGGGAGGDDSEKIPPLDGATEFGVQDGEEAVNLITATMHHGSEQPRIGMKVLGYLFILLFTHIHPLCSALLTSLLGSAHSFTHLYSSS